MDIIGSIKKGIGTAQRKVTKYRAESESKSAHKATQLHNLRKKRLKVIAKIAREYGAQIEPLDTDVYVHKMIGHGGHEERGVHIPFGMPVNQIRIKLEKTFTKSALASKVLHGTQHVIRDVKKTKKALGDIRKELKKGSKGGGGSSLYPKIDWGM